MRFTVTSGVAVTEVVDRHESARAALEHKKVHIIRITGALCIQVLTAKELVSSNKHSL
jgi:hypothetical protein